MSTVPNTFGAWQRVDESPPVGPQYGVVHLDCHVQQLHWYLWFDEIAMG